MKEFLRKVPTASINLTLFAVFFIIWSILAGSAPPVDDGILRAVPLTKGSEIPADAPVYVSGVPEYTGVPADPLTGFSLDCLVLKREVEMYQYYIYDDTVYKGFSTTPHENITGKQSYTNPTFPEEISNAVFFSSATLNGMELDNAYLLTLFKAEKPCIEKNYTVNYEGTLPESDNGLGLKVYESCYQSGDPAVPSIGDIRVTYRYIPKDAVPGVTVFCHVEDGKLLHDDTAETLITDMDVTPERAYEEFLPQQDDPAPGLLLMAGILLVVAVIVYRKENKGKTGAKKTFAVMLALLIVLCAFPVAGFADFGDYAGDSDYGDWDDYDYDYDYDDYDYDYDYDYDDDDDVVYAPVKTSDYRYAGYPGSSFVKVRYYDHTGQELAPDTVEMFLPDKDAEQPWVNSTSALLLGVIAISVFIYFIRRKSRNTGKGGGYTTRGGGQPVRDGGGQAAAADSLRKMSEYTSIDPGFSETELSEKVSRMYVEFQNAWEAKDLTVLRPYLSDAFYATADRQLDAYRKNRQTNHVDRISVLGVTFTGFRQEKNEDIIIARLKTRIVDYVTDDRTGSIVRGSSTAEKFMDYEWTLARASGVRTGKNDGVRTVNCPNCGAPVDINKSAKCEYCGSILSVNASDWVVTGIRGIAQRTR